MPARQVGEQLFDAAERDLRFNRRASAAKKFQLIAKRYPNTLEGMVARRYLRSLVVDRA
jgi:hypothetical protein